MYYNFFTLQFRLENLISFVIILIGSIIYTVKETKETPHNSKKIFSRAVNFFSFCSFHLNKDDVPVE